MPRQSKANDDLVAEAREFFGEREGAESENRTRFVEDLRFAFVPGAQWDELARTRRQGRPCYSYNRVVGAINQVVGDQRMIQPRGRVRAVTKQDVVGTANKIEGLIRSIEADSNAEAIYDEAFKYAVSGGWGGWRVVPEYADEESFEQVLRIKRIQNPLTLYFDELADPWGRGAMRCVVAERISRKKYEALYGTRAATNVRVPRDSQGWFGQSEVRVAEYYRKEARTKTIALLSDGRIVEWSGALERELAEMAAGGLAVPKIERKRKVRQWYVVWTKIDGMSVLEGPIEYAYQHIPAVRLPGRYINIEGKQYYQSLHLHSKDAQRTYNYDRSSMVETVALTPRAPWIVTARMIKGYEEQWARANVSNAPYLMYDIDPDAPEARPTRSGGPEVPQAYMALAAHDAEDIRHTTGLINPAIEQQTRAGDAESGVALRSRMMAGDSGSYEFLDHFGKAIQFTHEILIDAIPVTYDTRRIVRILGIDGRESFEEFDPEIFRQAKYDVTVTLGPAYATARMEALDTLLTASNTMPEIREEAPDIIVRNLDVQGADEIERRIRRRLILAGKLQPTEDEAAELPKPPPPDPTQVALVRRLEAQAERDEAAAQKTGAEAAAAIVEARAAERRELLELRQLVEDIARTQAETALMIKELRSAPATTGSA